MTKRVFKIVAQAIKEEIADEQDRKALAARMAEEFIEQNPRFDEELFYKACGIEG
jgi:hypothetical protein